MKGLCYIVELFGDSPEIMAGPLAADNAEALHAELVSLYQTEPFEEREFLVLTVEASGDAYFTSLSEEYVGTLEDEAWLGMESVPGRVGEGWRGDDDE